MDYIIQEIDPLSSLSLINEIDTAFDMALTQSAEQNKITAAHVAAFQRYLVEEMGYKGLSGLIKACLLDVGVEDFAKNPLAGIKSDAFGMVSNTDYTERYIKHNFKQVLSRIQEEASEIDTQRSLAEYLYLYQGDNNFTLEQLENLLAGKKPMGEFDVDAFYKRFALNVAHIILLNIDWYMNDTDWLEANRGQLT